MTLSDAWNTAGIYSRDQGQTRTSPPAHLNLAGIAHILDRYDIPWPKIAPFILYVNQFNDRPGIILFAQSQHLLAAGKWLVTGAQLMQKLRLKSRENFCKPYPVPALDRSLIIMSVPDNPTSRNQGYIKKRQLLTYVINGAIP